MDPTTATTVLLVLGSAFGVMFATMTTLLVVSIRVQHRESLDIRTEVGQQIERAFDRLRVQFTEMLDSGFAAQDDRIGSGFAAQDDRIGSGFAAQDDRIGSGFAAQDDRIGSRFAAQDARLTALESGLAELKRTVEQNHETAQHNHEITQDRLDRFGSDLADIRERVARIEGHLGIGLYPQDPAAPDERDSDAA